MASPCSLFHSPAHDEPPPGVGFSARRTAMNPTDVDLNAGSVLRRSLLGYFAAWIVLLVALVAAWSWIERRASEDIDTLQHASKTYTDELSRLRLLLAEERIAWSEVLLRGWEQARYHDLLSRYYEGERQSRSALERIGPTLPDVEAVRALS